MILLIDTSTPICQVWLVDGDRRYDYQWEANRSLARDLLAYLRDRLAEHNLTYADLKGIGVFLGPGSFTGLRIGMTVMNTLADSLNIPIVGSADHDWREEALTRLASGENDKLVLPEYGRAANITAPKK